MQLIGGMVLTRARSPRCVPVKVKPGGHAAGLSERALGARASRRHVNDYLARRDAAGWACSPLPRHERRRDPVQQQDHSQPRAAYAADITYGTNNEFGFDYLRDNMAFTPQTACSAAWNFAIHRRRGRTRSSSTKPHPLIISGPAEDIAEPTRRHEPCPPEALPGQGGRQPKPAPGHYTSTRRAAGAR